MKGAYITTYFHLTDSQQKDLRKSWKWINCALNIMWVYPLLGLWAHWPRKAKFSRSIHKSCHWQPTSCRPSHVVILIESQHNVVQFNQQLPTHTWAPSVFRWGNIPEPYVRQPIQRALQCTLSSASIRIHLWSFLTGWVEDTQSCLGHQHCMFCLVTVYDV